MTNSVRITEELLLKKLHVLARDCNKGTNGTLNIIAGSSNYRGAASLCVGGALRTGVGLVRLISEEKVISAVASRHPCCTFCAVSDNSERQKAIAGTKANAFLIGCGSGQQMQTLLDVSLVLDIGKSSVIDADALNIIAKYPHLMDKLDGTIVTPHVGEFSRLSGYTVDEIKASPEKRALEFSKTHKCVTVLKDYITVIATPSGSVYVSDSASEGLSKGGSGDVLAGIISGFLAQGYSAEDSAVIGVAVHAFASKLCARELGARSMLPSDLDFYVSKLFVKLGY